MDSISDAVREQQRAYSAGADRPLGSYGVLLTGYGLAVAAGAVIARLSGRRIPELGLWDIALMTVSTHKLSRALAKGPVTSPLRAPFTRYEGVSGPSELTEEVRGSGARHAVGELLTCPFCLAQWIGSGYVAGMTFAPRATRLAGATITAVTGADWLQLAYERLKKAAEG
ncbi:MAG: DUF1360 domain-containing protein [Actinomadura sp.]